MSSNEPVAIDDTSRYVMFPIRYPKLWNAYKQALASFWTADEVIRHAVDDVKHWTSDLTADERSFFSTILAFFAASDGIVAENLAQQFFAEIRVPEARCFYGFQIAMENIHSETYAHFLKAFVTDVQERDHLFRAMESVPSIKAKADWCFKWFDHETHSLAVRILAFAIVEGLFFCSSFAAIYWVRQRGILPGLCFSNELIARDEELHMRFACLLYSELVETVPTDTVYTMMKEAVDLEKAFFSDALNAPFEGMNADLMGDYVEFTADYVLACMKYPTLFNTPNPFMFMTMLNLPGRSNFFERAVSDYSGIRASWSH